jgi:putative ABC transport system permease protein
MIVKAMTSHYRRHPLQLLALALMIVVATMLWTGVSVLTGQARESLAVSEEAVAAREAVVRVDGQPVSVTDFVTLRRAGICVAPWLETARGNPARRVIGIDPLAMACFDAPPASGNAGELAGEPFVDISEVAGDSDRSESPGQLSLLISPGTGALPEAYQRKDFRLGPATGELADSFLLNLDALSLLVLFITGLLVRSVYHLGLAQRRSSFALLERFGVTKAQIQRLLAVELTLLTLICVVPGVWFGQALANRLGQGFGLALDSLFDLSLYAGDDTPVPWQAAIVMMALVLGVCLVDRLLPQRPAHEGKSSWLAIAPGWVCVSMAAAGLTMVIWASSLVWVFAGTALVFAGVGGLMPGVLARCAEAMARRQTQSPRSPLARWRYRELAVMFRNLALPPRRPRGRLEVEPSGVEHLVRVDLGVARPDPLRPRRCPRCAPAPVRSDRAGRRPPGPRHPRTPRPSAPADISPASRVAGAASSPGVHPRSGTRTGSSPVRHHFHPPPSG